MTFHTMQNSAAYNSLPEVFLADSALLSNDRNNIIEKLFEIIYKHKAEAFVGLRLLHKHNTIFENELMIEDVSFDKEGFALITRAQAIVGRSEDIVPNSWILSNFTFIPLEYSKRELVHEPTFNPDTQIVFFTELAEKLLELGVSQLIGPALISSDLVEKNKPQGANLMFEMSDHDGRANILRFGKDEDLEKGSSIETFWCATTENKPPSSPSKIKPKTVCTRFCPYVQNPPVHQGTYIHQQS